ncbi:MAG TPA: hypothetical protein VKZ81_30205 [Pseudonocardia sp.]|nr:hypothetical protein [Pseudonocardia sp.]HLU59754.1 hypothetical protein [Pseudonocardia sp.]
MLLVDALAQRQRVEEPVADPGVCEPPPPVGVDQQHGVVAPRRVAAGRAQHARLRRRHREARSAQQRGEPAVLLVAVAAAPSRDDLVQQARLVQADLPAELDVEVSYGTARRQARCSATRVAASRPSGPA